MNRISKQASLRSAFVLAVAASGCGMGFTGPDPVVFEDITWRLESLSYTDGTFARIGDPNAFTARFGGDDSLHAQADCNVCNGSYQSAGDAISIGLMACTKAYCVSTAPLDTDYISALGEATRLSMDDEKLILRGSGVTLTFQR